MDKSSQRERESDLQTRLSHHNGTLPRRPSVSAGKLDLPFLTDADTFDETDFLEFADSMRMKTGIDLSLYKQPQVRRRLNTLRIRKGFPTFMDFFRVLDSHPEVQKEFIDQLTINVTEFYRNPERWSVLTEKVVPDLLSHATRIKCWSAACSTGEEPYSVVLSLSEKVDLDAIDVLATDIDPSVLLRAQEAVYPSQAVRSVPEGVLRRYFTVHNDRYLLSDMVKRRVRFLEHNLHMAPPDTGFDLIVCRNVLIYFTQAAKELLILRFTQALKPGGYLFVGGTEQISSPGAYGLESPYTFFYRKRETH